MAWLRRRPAILALGCTAVLAAVVFAVWATTSDSDDPPTGVPTGETPTATPPSAGSQPLPLRREVRADCFPQWCSSSSSGPLQSAPANLEWVLPLIPQLEANGILASELRLALLSSMFGVPEEPSAYLWTNFGVLQLLPLPDGVAESDIDVQEWPEAAFTPATSDQGRCPWSYRLRLPGTDAQTVCAAHRMYFVVGTGMIALATEPELAARAAQALEGRRVP